MDIIMHKIMHKILLYIYENIKHLVVKMKNEVNVQHIIFIIVLESGKCLHQIEPTVKYREYSEIH